VSRIFGSGVARNGDGIINIGCGSCEERFPDAIDDEIGNERRFCDNDRGGNDDGRNFGLNLIEFLA